MIYIFCLPLFFLNSYNFKSSKRIRNQSVQEILDNEYAELRVDTRIKTDIILIELGITSQYSLQIVETEKLRKYDLLANELGLIYKCNGIVTKYHKSHLKRLEIPMNKTVEIISFDRRRGLESRLNAEESYERASMGVEDGAKNFKPKNKAPIISQGGTTLEEPTNNINEESDLGRRNGSDKRN
ncbi:hypothetical protein CWI38_0275p0020 [Hamiltosporidium tvaerminnensis]|uniref:Uncharacterized protein n=1 Tax=Hamiltosporidium tvaerminnensis TaxID=1176355 RepID=A0A4Q9LYS7_9MICR|nr:hypothetical protein CWI38_0275p0020 [Hamiltosporidium tvaerminnensis]